MTEISAKDWNKAVANGDVYAKKNGKTFGLKKDSDLGKELYLITKKQVVPRKKSATVTQMENELLMNFSELTIVEFEYPFTQIHKIYGDKKKLRRFKADFAFPELRLLIEYHGLNSEKSGHTTITGFSKDTDKANYAAQLGYHTMSYTILNYTNLIQDVENWIQNNCNVAER
jgi:hypothetical protein